MTNERLSKLLGLNFKKSISDTIQGPYGTLTLGPNLKSWQCSAPVGIFSKAASPSEVDKLSNLNLQASKLGI